MSDFIDIGAVEDIPLRAARVVKTANGCIAIFRTAANKIYAIDDKCPHKGGPLSNGIQHAEAITCPLHNWVFDLNSGQAQGMDEGAVQTYETRVEDGRILLDRAAIYADMAAE